MLFYIIFFSILVLLTANFIILISLEKIFRAPNLENTSLKFSIVIAAKNESENITGLISSLKALDYPKENFEIIIVDDNSSDNTFQILSEMANNLESIKIFKAEDKKYYGKRGALQYGIDKSNYDHILITDADCKPSKKWLKRFAYKFEEGYDFVFGNAPFEKNENNLINKISRFENLRSSILSFALAEINLPYSAAARSFGFQKNAFKQIKGYQNTTAALSGDDDLLLKEAIKNNLKIGTVLFEDAFVFSGTKNNFKSYLKQKARHTTTSKHYLIKNKITLGFWHLLNLACLFSPVLCIFNFSFILLFFAKLIFDIRILTKTQNKLSYNFNFIEIIYLQIIYEILIIINFIYSSFTKTEWK